MTWIPKSKNGTRILATIVGLTAIIGFVFAGTEIRYTPRINFATHVIASDINNLHNLSALIQVQLNLLEDRRERKIKNGGSTSEIRELDKRIKRLEKEQQEVDKIIIKGG
jgi:hypothetical protein